MGKAKRFDTGKVEFDLIPPKALEEIAAVFTVGGKKYGARNWMQGMVWSRTINSLMRHTNAFRGGEDLDPESGLPHMAHVAANAIFLLHYARYNKALDDRLPSDGEV